MQHKSIQDYVFLVIREKTGNIQIHLESTANARTRLILGTHHKNFINRKDALLWLIYSYNLKHLKNVFEPRRQKVIVETREANKSVLIEKAALTLFKKIAYQEYFDMETYRGIKDRFCALKVANAFTKQEMDHVHVMVIEQLNKMLEETHNHKRHLVLKKYIERLQSRNSME